MRSPALLHPIRVPFGGEDCKVVNMTKFIVITHGIQNEEIRLEPSIHQFSGFTTPIFSSHTRYICNLPIKEMDCNIMKSDRRVLVLDDFELFQKALIIVFWDFVYCLRENSEFEDYRFICPYNYEIIGNELFCEGFFLA